MRRALIVLATIVAATTAAPRAHAGEAPATSYAVIAFDVSGVSDETLRAKVEAGLTRGVAEAGADLVGFEAVQAKLASKPALVGCQSPTCLAGIAHEVGTDELLVVKITANGANYQLELTLVSPDGASRKRTGACTVCTVADLSDLAATKVTDLLTAQSGGPLPVSIATRPTGAALAIAGVGAVVAPWTGTLPAGKVAVDAHYPGYRDLHQELTVVDDGSDQHFDLALSRRAATPRWHVVKYGTAGGAAAVLVTGLVLLAIDGDPSCGDSHAQCPRLYSTAVPGAIFTVVGLAGAGAAGWMFWQDHKSGREATVTAAPTATGASASLRLRF